MNNTIQMMLGRETAYKAALEVGYSKSDALTIAHGANTSDLFQRLLRWYNDPKCPPASAFQR